MIFIKFNENRNYAKIGNEDVRDKEGKMKWNTKEEAEKAAEWFCQYLNWKTSIKK